MTIKVDGERSRKRLPVAKKTLSNIIEMGLPAKGGMFEGFLYKVWQMDGGNITGGQITSPPGVLVTLSYPDGTRQFTYDSFETVGAGPAQNRWLLAPSPLPEVADGYRLLKNTDGLGVVEAVGEGVSGYVVPFPFAGDSLLFCAAYNTGVSPDQHHVTAIQVNSCYSTGGAATGTSYAPGFTFTHKDYVSPLVLSPFTHPFTVVPTLIWNGFFEGVSWKPALMFLIMNGTTEDWLLGLYHYYDAPTGSYGLSALTLLTTVTDMPAAVTSMLSVEPPSQTAAHYVRTANDVLGIHVVALDMGTSAYQEWALLVLLTSLANPTSNQVLKLYDIGPVLDPYMYNGGALAYLMAVQPFEYTGTKPDELTDPGLYAQHCQFAISTLCGWPADGSGTLQNSRTAFFHSDAADYYSVKIVESSVIGFKFDRAAGTFEAATLTLPQQLLDDVGVGLLDFKITHLAIGVYMCVVTDAGGGIAGLHLGSPLTGTWSAVSLPVGATLRTVRPLVFDATRIGFIAVGRDAAATTYPYRTYSRPPGATWSALAPVGLTETGYTDDLLRWDVAIFGNNGMASAMNNAIQYPITA